MAHTLVLRKTGVEGVYFLRVICYINQGVVY